MTKHKRGSDSLASRAANTRFSGSWLIMARMVWLALVIPSVGFFKRTKEELEHVPAIC
jgi:hypothetical protein